MKNKFFFRIPLILLIIVLFSSVESYGQHNYAFGKEEKAFDGNDLISYFDGEVKKGKDNIGFKYNETTLLFSSEENRERFKADPEKYFPAYNGWCATAIASGSLARPDFNNYKIQDGRLLFFEVRAFFNGRTAWEKDPDINKITADQKFGQIFKEVEKKN